MKRSSKKKQLLKKTILEKNSCSKSTWISLERQSFNKGKFRKKNKKYRNKWILKIMRVIKSSRAKKTFLMKERTCCTEDYLWLIQIIWSASNKTLAPSYQWNWISKRRVSNKLKDRSQYRWYNSTLRLRLPPLSLWFGIRNSLTALSSHPTWMPISVLYVTTKLRLTNLLSF
jgi:hypothetical protein